VLARLGLAGVLKTATVSEQANVGQVVAQVALGAADAGFVYTSDARNQRRVQPIAIPERAQPTVLYQGCIVRRKGVDATGARRVLDALRSGSGQRTLHAYGFGVPRGS
jgi:ABC-type molybdate transport system substrate-binding protein